jgi:TonB family protein
LGETEHSTVFSTELENGDKAAIKFMPAEAHEGTKQLAYWKRAAQLSHPHLLKIFESGRWQLSGRNQVYVVMQYADENLGEIVPSRALTSTEAREMLEPLLDCLGYLHGSGFVHGQLKPGNIMAADNQLKLSSDGIKQAGESYSPAKNRSGYNPPEAGSATLSPSADVWSLGVTLVEVLTQRMPDWENSAGEPVVPPSLPEPFREIARNCLKRDANARWTVPQIKTRLKEPRSSAPAMAKSQPVVAEAKRARAEAKPARNLIPVVLAAVVLLAVVAGTVLFRRNSTAPASNASQLAPPKAEQMEQAPAKPAPGQPSNSGAAGTLATSSGQGDVLRQVAPKISPSAQRSIRGRIKLRVRTHVDAAGNVTRADLLSAGPSKYFARLVVDAAREWKFVPSTQGGRRYILHFDLTRRGNSAHAEQAR